MAYYNGHQLTGIKTNMTVVDDEKLKELSLANEPYNNKKVNDVNNIVGYKGYKMIGYALSNDGKSVEIELRDAELHEKARDKYAVGNKVNIEADTHSYQKEVITAITENDKGNTVLTLEEVNGAEISFKLEAEDGTDIENWLYVVDKYVGEPIPQFSNALVSGVNGVAAGYASFVGGRDGKVFGNYGVHLGRENIAAYLAIALGLRTKALGRGSLTHGKWSEALEEYAIALGDYTLSKGLCSLTLGAMDHQATRTQALADFAISLGLGNIAGSNRELGKGAIATGYGTRAYGPFSLTLGNGTQTGELNKGGDNGLNALAGGQGSISKGKNSLTYGELAEALFWCGVSLGYKTKSNNEAAVALCCLAVANAYASFAAGMGVKTNSNGPAGQAALGKYNVGKTDTVLEVGNGSSAERKNAFEVNLDGTATVLTDPQKDMDVATKQYVDRLEKEIEALKQAILSLGGVING